MHLNDKTTDIVRHWSYISHCQNITQTVTAVTEPHLPNINQSPKQSTTPSIAITVTSTASDFHLMGQFSPPPQPSSHSSLGQVRKVWVNTRPALLIVYTGHATTRHFVSVRARGLGRRTLKRSHITHNHTQRQTTSGHSHRLAYHIYYATTSIQNKMAPMAWFPSSLIGRMTSLFTIAQALGKCRTANFCRPDAVHSAEPLQVWTELVSEKFHRDRRVTASELAMWYPVFSK